MAKYASLEKKETYGDRVKEGLVLEFGAYASAGAVRDALFAAFPL